IASNHLSFSDAIFMPLMVSRRVTFLAKQEYFTGRGLKGMLSRLFFTGVGQVPIDRSSGSAAKAALETGKRILADGQLLDFSRYEGLAGDRFVERSMTDEIMYELMELGGQEYVDLYAAKVKAQIAAGGKIGLPDAAEITDAFSFARRVTTEKAS